MSLIPKISLGIATKRSKSNMSFDSQTTANIGFVQPTMARMLVPNSSINVKNRTLVRLSPLVNPTFGRLSQRDYYTFVRMSDVYHPWAEFLSGKNYTPSDGASYVPTALPRFRMADIVALCMSYNADVSFSPADDVNVTIGWNEDFSQAALDNLMRSIASTYNGLALRNLADGTNPVSCQLASDSDLDDPFGKGVIIMQGREGIDEVYYSDSAANNYGVRASHKEIVTFANSDITIFVAQEFTGSYIYRYAGSDSTTTFDLTDGVYIHFRFKPFAKNLRKIFIGLGYGFNLWDKELYTPFKLIAYYKAWFDSFVPLRDYQFTDTYVYKLIKRLETTITEQQLIEFMHDMIFTGVFSWKSAFYYYTAPDYFSASLYNLGDNSLDSGQNSSIISPSSGNINSYNSVSVISNNTVNSVPNGGIVGLSIQLMLRLMRFTNKNNVIGRSIREYAKTHYNIDDLDSDQKQVVKINSHRVNINFDDVMNTAASPDAFLGEYAGKGLGYKESDSTQFTTEDFGFFFCMSVIVPESGYFQGSLKENKIADKFEFFTPEFDALGYDVITRGEIKNDFDAMGISFNPTTFDTSKGFGFIPRYTHFKVSRNIVNGDLSLKSTRDGLQGYYLDKVFPSIKEEYYDRNAQRLVAPDFLPETVSTLIRRIDPSDNIGNFNRIFQYTDIDMDHFIIQKVFDVQVTAPWKSVSDSFDTVQNDESVINRNHQ